MFFDKLIAKKTPLKELDRLVKGLVRYLIGKADPIKIYLIGSAARDEFTKFSDLDFVVVLPDSKDSLSNRAKLIVERPYKSVPVDFLFVGESHFEEFRLLGGIAHEAVHHGILLHDRNAV